jgi:anthranilate synthase component II
MLLMIDNYDSFTYNLVQYFSELGADVHVYRHDQINLAQIAALSPSHLVISPGPCTPNEAGISLAAIQHFAGKIPLLGVCLGHQAIGQVFGAEVILAQNIMHGKVSQVHHNAQGIFQGIPNDFMATRYHSLVLKPDTLPECLEITAWTEHANGSLDDIMGIKHRFLPLEGMQFHPESILTEHGHALLANFLQNKV